MARISQLSGLLLAASLPFTASASIATERLVEAKEIERSGVAITKSKKDSLAQLPAHLSAYESYLSADEVADMAASYRAGAGHAPSRAVDFLRLPDEASARQLLEQLGGREPLLKAAANAYLKGEDRWATQLTGYLLRLNPDDVLATQLRSKSLSRIGYIAVPLGRR